MAGRYVLPDEGSITISQDAARKIMGSASGDAALLYIYILTNGGQLDESAAAGAIHRSEEQVAAALSVLSRLGLVAGEREAERPAPPLRRPDELPQYTPEELERGMKSREFQELLAEVQAGLGTQLNPDGMRTLYGMMDYLSLPPDVIVQLVHFCIWEYEDRCGQGRRPSMRYIEKEAYVWSREKIYSLEASEAYIRRRKAAGEGERQLAPVLGISGRAMSATERRYVDSWLEMGFGPEAVSAAYDRTVVNTGKLTWRYMDSILRNWHSKGLHTPEEIRAGDAPPKFKKPPRRKAPPQEPATGDMERMMDALRQIKGETDQQA